MSLFPHHAHAAVKLDFYLVCAIKLSPEADRRETLREICNPFKDIN
tara:strand:- start:613 stop:750 length:138 start_codon:yes stop_codon:yes gene_type:complete